MGSGNTLVKPWVLGVTGAAGAGKSTFCHFLEKECGFVWISAVDIVHELYKPGQGGYKRIKEYFGSQFVGKFGVHRGRLRRFVLKTPEKIWILNKLMHALVAHEVNKKIVQMKSFDKGQKPILICLEAAYFERHDLGKFVDRIVILDAPDDVLFKRVKSRGVPETQIKALIKFQRKHLPREAGLVIKNEGSVKKLFESAHRLYDRMNP